MRCINSIPLLLTFLILSLSGCNSSKEAQKNNCYDKNQIKSYLEIINKAELNIIKGEFSTALEQYTTAFKLLPSAHVMDYFNASVLAIKVSQDKKALKFLENIFLKGVSLNTIREQRFYSELEISDKELWSEISRIYLSVNNKKQRIIDNNPLSKSLDSLRYMDRLFRLKGDGNHYEVYGDTIHSIDHSNIKYLKEICQKQFPSECLVGTKNLYGKLSHYIVMHHSFQFQRDITILDPELDAAILSGDIHPYFYAYLKDIASRKMPGDYGTLVFTDMEKNILKEMDASHLAFVNANRKRIGLSSLSDYHKKIAYSFTEDKDFLFHKSYAVHFRYLLPPRE